MGALVSYEVDGSIATISMDDGKVNVLTFGMLEELNAALDRAESDRSVVILRGRDGVFSAGFDLAVLRGGGVDSVRMLRKGFELAYRILSFPGPVVISCTGHAIAMGVFVLLSGDYRVGVADGPYKITANEVAIGMTLPRTAVELCRQRLTPAHFNRAAILSEVFSPEAALDAGFLDRVVPAPDLAAAARATAELMMTLDPAAHTATKLRAREGTLSALRTAMEADDAEFRSQL
jgi:enoyl-CoA hydratase/carnithine racemase